MGRRKSRTLTEVELEFMRVIWDVGEVTTDDVLERLATQGRRLSDGTVRKVLSVLVAKGYISRRPDGRGFRYHAEISRDLAEKSMLVEVIDRAFRGSAPLMVAALLGTETITDEDLRKIKQLIDAREGGKPQ